MEIEKVKDIIDVNLIDKGLVKVTYSDITSIDNVNARKGR